MADSQTTPATTAGPALFTHDGHDLYVFDGVPYMLESDLGRKLGYAEDGNIARLVGRQEENLKRFGLVRRSAAPKKHGGRGKGNVKTGVVNFFNERQVMWLTAKSEAEAADDLLEQLIIVYDAWRQGKLTSAPERAELPSPDTARAKPFNAGPDPFGRPAAVAMQLRMDMRSDGRFTKIDTIHGIVVTLYKQRAYVLDADLGHAIGGAHTRLARAQIAQRLAVLRTMGPDPTFEIATSPTGQRPGRSKVYLLNQDQALYMVGVFDRDHQSDARAKIVKVFDAEARGSFGSVTDDPSQRDAAMSVDTAKRGYAVKGDFAVLTHDRNGRPLPQTIADMLQRKERQRDRADRCRRLEPIDDFRDRHYRRSDGAAIGGRGRLGAETAAIRKCATSGHWRCDEERTLRSFSVTCVARLKRHCPTKLYPSSACSAFLSAYKSVMSSRKGCGLF